MKKTFLLLVVAAVLGSALTIGSLQLMGWGKEKSVKIEHVNNTPALNAMLIEDEEGNIVPLDFTLTAEKATPAVVHIRSTASRSNRMSNNDREAPDAFRDMFGEDFMERFFGPNTPNQPRQRQGDQPYQLGTGSGVIISDDGYVVTNNHVIAKADDIEVTLQDDRSYKAKVIGTDPTTDIALLKIEGQDLPNLAFVNSDQVKVGQWVMAVGNPFNLNSTVTAGIVSAKGRSISILREQYAIESFIQTDAAINPGNSGGALVNLNGDLIGINTAIASPTGSYSGYGFAVPSNIAAKVVKDLMEFGAVQRGVLGITIRDINSSFAQERGLSGTDGIYVDSLMNNSAAEAAGIQKGDIILEVDGSTVNSVPKLQELIGRHRPGDKVAIKVDRDGRQKEYTVVLKNREGNQRLVTRERSKVVDELGADLATLDKETAKDLDIKGGVRINRLYAGKLRQKTDVREGFIITHVDKQPVTSVEALTSLLEKKEGGILLEGVYVDKPGKHYYGFGM